MIKRVVLAALFLVGAAHAAPPNVVLINADGAHTPIENPPEFNARTTPPCSPILSTGRI